MSRNTSRFTNKHHLTTKSYRTQDNLNIRIQTHERYTEPKVDFTAWVLDKIEWRGDETVVDVGCGSGVYAKPARQRCRHYIAGDLACGMLRGQQQPDLDRINLDAQQLPLPDQIADVVLANHMLYHVPDIAAALTEIDRVLRPGGALIATTNSATNMGELITLRNQALQRLNLSPGLLPQRSPVAGFFSLENGRSPLSQHFYHVARHDLTSALIFPSAKPLLNYINSSRDWYESHLPPHVVWDDFFSTLALILDSHFAIQDELRINKLSGVFVCRNHE